MTVASGIETRAQARVRAMLADCPTFLAWIGANVDPQSRIHDDEIIENEDPQRRGDVLRPLALIENPTFDLTSAATSGLELDYRAGGEVTLLLESAYYAVEISALDIAAKFKEFKGIVGQIREELMARRNKPLPAGSGSYVYFDSIPVKIPPMKTAEEDAAPGNLFFAVQWTLSAGRRGGE